LQCRPTALGARVGAFAVTAPVALAQVRSRRRRSLTGRGAELRQKARRLGQAFERIADDPNRLAPPPPGLGSRTAVAVATMMAQILATAILRTLVKQREA